MLTAERLRELLYYDPETGVFMWLMRTNRRIQVGDVAGSFDKAAGYVHIRLDGKLYKAHRLAWLWVYGVWPVDQIDHINTVRHDNRIANLREASNQLNGENRRRVRSDNKSGFLGVGFDTKTERLYARIQINGKSKHLGRFETPELAHAAYLAAKREHHKGNTL